MGKTNACKGGGNWSFAKMCVVVCFNSQWRSVVIGTVSCICSLFLLFLTIGYHDMIDHHLESRIIEKNCYQYSELKNSQQSGSQEYQGHQYSENPQQKVVNWTKTLQTEENECIFIAFTVLFPWPLWTVLSTYAILNGGLILSAVYKFTTGVTIYLSLDALYIGMLAAALCMSLFPSGLTRIGLLTLLFPLFSLALCAWMTVFGFYLRLEDRERRKEKRQVSRQAVERGIKEAAYRLEQKEKQIDGTNEIYSHSNYTELPNSKNAQKSEIESQFVNLAFEIDEERVPKNSIWELYASIR